MIPAELLTPDNLIWAGKLAMVLCCGFSLGLTMPDIDLAPPLPLSHRSAWTHGLLVPVALWYLGLTHEWLRLFSVAFLPGFALHLSYDMFPKAWQSIAKISLHPLPGRLPGFFSFMYLWLGVIFAFSVEFLLLEELDYICLILVILLGVGISYKHYMHKEPGGWPWPLNRVGVLKKFAYLPPMLALVLGGGVAGAWVFYLKQ